MNTYNYEYEVRRRAEYKKRAMKARRQKELAYKSFRLLAISLITIFALSIGSVIVKASDDNNKKKVNRYFETVEINSNDTLWDIAEEYNNGSETTAEYVRNLISLNGLSNDNITAGKDLIIYYYSSESK